MSTTKLEEWIDIQRRLVEQDGTHCARLQLEGPDGIMGTWPVGTEDLHEVIKASLELIAAELPSGRHATKLLALDADGKQVSYLPQTITGKSQEAARAAAEQKTLAQATGIAIGNLENVQAGLVSENDRLRNRCNELLDNETLLTKTLVQILQQTLDDDVKREESKAKIEALKEIGEVVKPLLEVFTGMVGERLIEANELAKEKKLRGKKGTNGTKPANGSGPNLADGSETAAAHGQGGRSGNDRGGR
ncbi:MAG: hypothetical protein JSV86_18480 [Gemmatimonadota bacterium]|nr:MAG: hypothetical protein JSV86_18480 [Gemmatimonadota bacterium]